MSKMLKRTFAVALAALFVLPFAVQSKDMTGKMGLGYFSSDAPVGGRIWLGERAAVDLGVGFEMKDVYFSANGGTPTKEKATSFWFEAGVPYVVYPGDRANFFVRPGVVFGQLDDRVYGTGALDETWTQITISATLGAEVFFGEQFSLEAGHGIAIDMLSVPDAVGAPRGGETETTIRSFDASVTYLGFHFYFK